MTVLVEGSLEGEGIKEKGLAVMDNNVVIAGSKRSKMVMEKNTI